MEIIDNMYYGFGRIILALSLADGKVDQSEIEMLETSIDEIAEDRGYDLSMVTTAFQQWKTVESFSTEEMMRGGLHDFHLGDLHLTTELASIFRSIVIDVVSAEPPITGKEQEMAREFISYLNEREQHIK
ncbi:MAG: hypothetical protein GQ574_21700 [Crocinitomix sp.]|nr:hypothetical protein [Crocinitomix sp.]